MFLMPRSYKYWMKARITEAKEEVRQAKGLRVKCIALYKLWSVRDYFSTLTNKLICWCTRTNKVIAGAILRDAVDYDGSIREESLKYVEKELGCKVTKKARAIVDRVLAAQKEIREIEAREVRKFARLQKEEDQRREQEYKVVELDRRVKSLEEQMSKLQSKKQARRRPQHMECPKGLKKAPPPPSPPRKRK